MHRFPASAGRACALLTIAGLLGACAQTPERGTGGAQPMACNADAARDAIGKPVSDGAVQQAQQAAGAASVRVIRPGQPVTMDHRGDRLNVEVSAQDTITSLRCG